MAFYQKFFGVLLCMIAAAAWSKEQAIPELPAEETQELKPMLAEEALEPLVKNEIRESTLINNTLPRYFNALQLTGYFRTRFNYWRNPQLGTYVPQLKRGTSNFAPRVSAYKESDETSANPNINSYAATMKLRLNPTINISELTRVKSTIDIFDNLVLGSTPRYMASQPNFMSRSQDSSALGVNSWQSIIAIRRVWGEANFPIGEFRFGRMPLHWGLGILYNSGDTITSDYGDQIDGFTFTTRILDHLVTPSYSIAFSGPVGRGGGFSSDDNKSSIGQPYALESSELTHVLSLSILKRETDFITQKKHNEGSALFNYGLFASYRTQEKDTQENNLIKRNAHVGMGSLWSAFSYKTFHIEAEFAGIWGKYHRGEKASEEDQWLLQGGFALESRYGFLSDRLQVGLDSGLASAQSSKYKSNFKFNPAYNIDLLLYREVLDGIEGTYYFKPHISYFFSRNFGIRGDAISSFALKASDTSGKSNLLGVEIDASAFLRTENGFYLSMSYGVLFPLKGLDHARTSVGENIYNIYGHAKTAQTLQFYAGLMF